MRLRQGIDPDDDLKSINVDQALKMYEKCCLDNIKNGGNAVADDSVLEFIDMYLQNTKESLCFFHNLEESAELAIECLGNVLINKLKDDDCNESDKEKIYDKFEELAEKGAQNAADNLFDIVIEDNGEGKGRYGECTFNALMKLEWFANKVNTEFPQPIGRVEEENERTYSAKHSVSTNLANYFKRFPNSQLIEDIAMHRILYQKDIVLGYVMAIRLMKRKNFDLAFKICLFVFRLPEDSPYDWMEAEGICQMLGKMYEYGLGTAIDLHKAIYYYKLCYEALRTDCGYYVGRCYEKLGDEATAMKYYREIIDEGNYRETDYYRHNWNSEKAKYFFNSVPYRLEISFRRLKKKMKPSRHDELKITTNGLISELSIDLHVLMNAVITIDWGDGSEETIKKWKVNGWHNLYHCYPHKEEEYYPVLGSNKEIERIDFEGEEMHVHYVGEDRPKYNVTITSDEGNVIMGIRSKIPYTISAVDVRKCKGLMYLICPNQSIETLYLERLPYLREVNVHGNLLQYFFLGNLNSLTAVDVSNNPLGGFNMDKYVPIRLLSIRGISMMNSQFMRRLVFSKIEKNVESNMGRITEPFKLDSQYDLYPTMSFYIRSSTWKAIRRQLIVECPGADSDYFETARKAYEQILKEKPQKAPEGIFLEVDGSFVYPCKGWKDQNGVYKESYTDGEDFYVTTDNPWEVSLGTPLRDSDNRQPFMMKTPRKNAYYAAMCLINLMENDKEMERHGLESVKGKSALY